MVSVCKEKREKKISTIRNQIFKNNEKERKKEKDK
jgi:hypothetical protein